MNFRRGKYFCFCFLSTSLHPASLSALSSFLLVVERPGICWIFTDNLDGRGQGEAEKKEEEKKEGWAEEVDE